MNHFISHACLWTLMVALVCGCSENTTGSNDNEGGTQAKVDATPYLLDAAPESAHSVLEVREAASNDEEVVISGRIGGSTHPWVEGVAAFTIVDATLPACGDEEECNCPTPWDYCCETSETIASHSATIKRIILRG